MKHKLAISVLASVIALVYTTQTVVSQNVAQGTLIKAEGKPEIYYFSNDGKKYHIPEVKTFYSWYRDFRGVAQLPQEVVSSYPTARQRVTVHPGTVMVKFPSSPKVYAIDNAATLRWIKSEEVAQRLYGFSWSNRIIHLPSHLISDYRFGPEISDPADFNRNKIVNTSKYIDDELNLISQFEEESRRIAQAEAGSLSGIGSTDSQSKAQETKVEEEIDYTANLLSLSTSLRSRISPSFHPDIVFYRLVADFNEKSIEISYTTDDPKARVIVSGLSSTQDTPVSLSLGTGRSVIPLHVRTQNGKRKSYYITVVREKADNNNRLHSLYEDLEDGLDPHFHTAITEYKLKAKYLEDRITLRGSAESNRAEMRLNGEEWSGWHQTLLLEPGENIFNISVKAESGNAREYELKVHRQSSPSSETTELKSLRTSLRSQISPQFDPDKTNYYVRAEYLEDRAEITAEPYDRNAYVLIDGVASQRRSVRLFPGRNEFDILVEVDGGYSTNYKIIIDRLLQ